MYLFATSGKRHWSTDYVEHLRTVHFSLVVLCVALIVLSLSRRPNEIQLAHAQIVQVQELVNGSHRDWDWNWDWLETQLKDQTAELERHFGHPPDFEYDTVTFESRGIIRRVPLSILRGDYIVRNPEKSPKGLIFLSSAIPFSDEQLKKPKTLREFRELWEGLSSENLFMILPEKISRTAFLIHPREFGGKAYSRVIVSFSKTGRSMGKSSGPCQDGPDPHRFFLGEYSQHAMEDIKKDNPQFEYRYYYGCTLSTEGSGTEEMPSEALTLPIESFSKVPFDGQTALIAHSRSEWAWHHGSFDYSFPQLSAATKEYEDLDITKIEQVLAEEDKRTGDSFEAIGVKFPADSVHLWGILIIVGIQLYFWIHLRERSSKLSEGDTGWDVAWIGVYPSKVARVAMFSSTLVLPVLAALSLGIRGSHTAFFERFHSPWTYWSLFTLSILFVCALGILACVCLPQNGRKQN